MNYLDLTFKFVDIVKIKSKPKESQEDLLFMYYLIYIYNNKVENVSRFGCSSCCR